MPRQNRDIDQASGNGFMITLHACRLALLVHKTIYGVSSVFKWSWLQMLDMNDTISSICNESRSLGLES